MSTNSSGRDRLGASVPRQDAEHAGFRSSSPVHSCPTETQGTAVRIIVADSEAIFRVGMGKIFAIEKDLEVVAQTETLQQTLGAVSDTPADVVLFEAGLSTNPPDAVSDVIRRAQPGTKVIIVAHHTGEEETVEYLRRGVRGILTRSISPDLLVRCVRKVAAGETWLDNQGVNWVIEAYRTQAEQGTTPKQKLRLSEKEMLIIGGVTQGLKNKDIAMEVGTTEQVVKNYLRKIYDKLGVSDRLELALYSMHRRLLDDYVPPAGRENLSPQTPSGTAASTPMGPVGTAPWPNDGIKKQ
jgi:DNA-binding NarL/FixJ family response regulator